MRVRRQTGTVLYVLSPFLHSICEYILSYPVTSVSAAACRGREPVIARVEDLIEEIASKFWRRRPKLADSGGLTRYVHSFFMSSITSLTLVVTSVPLAG